MSFNQSTARQADPETPVSESEPAPYGLAFVSLTVVSSPKHNTATIKLTVDGKETTVEYNGGVGPVDAICGALRDVVPDFTVLHCGTEESGPGSDAVAKAHVQVAWGDFQFEGEAENPNTLDATAAAIISALDRLRPIQVFAGGRAPKRVDDLWAGFLIDEAGGTRGKGEREYALFHVSFENGVPMVSFAKSPDRRTKDLLSKGYHRDHVFALIKTRTEKGDTCHLFTARVVERSSGGRNSCQLASR